MMSPIGDTVKTAIYKDYIFKDSRVSHDIVCDIWGMAELQANNILISFFGLDVFLGALLVLMHILHAFSIIQVQWVKEGETLRRMYWG